ncbi:hypothetical protein [Chthoniobacter flavus]|uniref:hypothetical protein n=1 Tax=Chthoniobacter flavus TaxID=191863 RepID=UPI00138B1484|nr:hypothetical protein [Chthoniobacter flavus]
MRIFIYSDIEGGVRLHVEGEKTTRECGDMLEAIDAAREVAKGKDAVLVVYDAFGKVIFTQPL